ncbi:MAG: hypothetical protein WC755_09070 [Candidatus Woesearchaeota archaeon]|jgi:hypothetical protein
MSTRCQIGFSDKDNNDFMKPNALLYRHSDGYPEGNSGVLKLLIPTICLFQKRRGMDDVEYMSAWVMYHLIQHQIQCTGFGICEDFHGDIEYYYHIKGNFLSVYHIENKDYTKNNTQENFILVQKFEFQTEKVVELNVKTGKIMKDQYDNEVPNDLVVMPNIHDLTQDDIQDVINAPWYEAGNTLLVSARDIDFLSEIDPLDAGVDLTKMAIYKIDDILKRYDSFDGFYHA